NLDTARLEVQGDLRLEHVTVTAKQALLAAGPRDSFFDESHDPSNWTLNTLVVRPLGKVSLGDGAEVNVPVRVERDATGAGQLEATDGAKITNAIDGFKSDALVNAGEVVIMRRRTAEPGSVRPPVLDLVGGFRQTDKGVITFITVVDPLDGGPWLRTFKAKV